MPNPDGKEIAKGVLEEWGMVIFLMLAGISSELDTLKPDIMESSTIGK
jgi:hypothetical protein